jgi:glycine/D-amino acid oxidase-like deaminating enzyme/nitrite reductase/ring-hydroxylating ferredoxin subunit
MSSGQTKSAWMNIEPPPFYPLEGNVSCDVCVIGAGIAGLTTAYFLIRSGLKVFVLDDGAVGGGETSRTTAHLTAVLDKRYHGLEELHGLEGARLAAESHTLAIDEIERIIGDEDIECGFERVDGYLFLGLNQAPQDLGRELIAAKRAGLSVDLVKHAPLINENSLNTGPALRFSNQAQFNPMRYLSALSQAIVARGGKVFARTHAREISGGDSPRVVATSGYSVSAGSIVIATNTPVNDLMSIHTKQTSYRTYVLGLSIPRDLLAPGLYWDTEDPYHYMRLMGQASSLALDDDCELLLVGGEDHRTGQGGDRDRYLRLESWARERFPLAREVAYRWSGQITEPADGLGFIGPAGDPNLYIATGDSGNGLTNGTIAGMVLCDLIMGRENPWADLYSPSRTMLGSLKDRAKETINTVLQLNEWVRSAPIESTDEIQAGEGGVVGTALKKLAVYRDDRGNLHGFSAVCPHLGCQINWNAGEKTFDCPCHGSRFDCFGRVINGPANSDLEPLFTEQPCDAASATRGR